MIGAVSLVGDGVLARLDGCEQRLGALDIGDVSARQQEGARSAFLVDDGMDLGRAAAARSANEAWSWNPLFAAPLAERCAFTAELSIMVSAGGSAHSTRAANRRCHLRPQLLAPTIVPVEHRRIRPVFIRKRTPSTSAFTQPVDDPADDAPITSCRSGPV